MRKASIGSTTEDTERTEREGGESKSKSSYSILKDVDVEIDKQSYGSLCEFHVSQKLCLMYVSEILYCFKFYDYGIFYMQVYSIPTIQVDIFVKNGDWLLSFE